MNNSCSLNTSSSLGVPVVLHAFLQHFFTLRMLLFSDLIAKKDIGGTIVGEKNFLGLKLCKASQCQKAFLVNFICQLLKKKTSNNQCDIKEQSFNILTLLWPHGFHAINMFYSPVCAANPPLTSSSLEDNFLIPLFCFAPSRCPDAKDNSFTRSRSSSVTSIDRESREAISAFHFCESFPRKNDSLVSPCLLVGTTQGSVMMVALSLPPGGDQRQQQPVGISSCGKKLGWTWFDSSDEVFYKCVIS